MGLGPVLCATAILRRHGLTLGCRAWELNGRSRRRCGCLAAWEDDKFCREALGLEGAAASSATSSAWAARSTRPSGGASETIVLHLVNA
jgi:acetyl-CoA C-acetyltransferase